MYFVNCLKFFIILVFIFATKYNDSLSAINNKIIAKIGNEIITSYELENKIKTTLILAKKEINQKNIDMVKRKAVADLINKKLKKEEINRFKMKAGKGQVESYIKDISARLGMSKENFKKMMSNNSISYDLYKEEIEIDLMWQSLIFELNKNKIIIDESQIEQQLNNYLKNNNKIDEYELAEIVIERMIEIENQKKIIFEIQKYIDEFNFEEAAIKYSNSTSSANGGKIGWVNFNDLSDQLKNILINMSPGEISDPINNADQTIFIQLKNKRKINNLDMNTNKIKESLINKRKNELLNIFSNNHLSKKRNNTIIKIFNE